MHFRFLCIADPNAEAFVVSSAQVRMDVYMDGSEQNLATDSEALKEKEQELAAEIAGSTRLVAEVFRQ